LLAFARFADRTASGHPLTTALALRWASRQPALPVTVANRLSSVRGFARFCAAFDPRTEVPPHHLTHCAARRRAPHIFTEEQVSLIMRRTSQLEPWRTNLRPLTYRTLVGLLACTGLRPGEALKLSDDDFDADTATLHVPAIKCSAPRFLPLHPTTVRALLRYQTLRRRRFPFTRHFFVGPFGRPLRLSAAQWTFRRLAQGIPSNGDRPAVRLYDFRHSVATKLIARWSCRAPPLANRLVLLSRYLGHKYFHHTYWYVQHDLSALKAATARFESYRNQSDAT
jgi:integrase